MTETQEASSASIDLALVETNLEQLSAYRPPVVIAQPRGELLSADALNRLRDHLDPDVI